MFTGIQFSGYKLFCDETMTEFDKITNVNVIIGKNNSGKSSLLDVIEWHMMKLLSKGKNRKLV